MRPRARRGHLEVLVARAIEIISRPCDPQNSIAAPPMPGTSVASNVAVKFVGYSSSTLMVSGAVRPSL